MGEWRRAEGGEEERERKMRRNMRRVERFTHIPASVRKSQAEAKFTPCGLHAGKKPQSAADSTASWGVNGSYHGTSGVFIRKGEEVCLNLFPIWMFWFLINGLIQLAAQSFSKLQLNITRIHVKELLDNKNAGREERLTLH
ncbi:unnamed protein product [Pleuronectes platessa]|uniref:Uncharacterized protein n=1 Tax=Pleuronectes platessa TaxID=8262 RepID=A0A9N7YB29_PLEPL|nr:unnamed protein product [Pleuronectes platessa]